MVTTTAPRVWLVTGASSGLGHEIAAAALRRGDTVVGTARDPERLAPLAALAPDRMLALGLDLATPEGVPGVVAAAIERFGRVDVLVNNAGRGQIGAVEETEPEWLRELMEIMFFGPVALVRAVLPHMRAQGGGTILQMSSITGQVGFPGMSSYVASKFALEGVSEVVAVEAAPFGVRVIIAELGGFRTAFQGARMHRSPALKVYADTVGTMRTVVDQTHGAQPGDPAKAATALLGLVDAPDLPLRVPVGDDAVAVLRATHARRADELEKAAHLAGDTNLAGEGWGADRLARMEQGTA